MNRREKMVTVYFYILIFLSLILVGFGRSSFLSSVAWHIRPPEILGFYTGPEPPLPSSETSVQKNSANITFIAPFFYRLKYDGTNIEKWNTTTDAQVRNTVKMAQDKDIKVLALVHNLLYGNSRTSQEAAHQVLKDATGRKRFISQALTMVKDNGFDGINLDVENIYPSDKDNISALVKEMKSSFSAAGLLVTVCVPAKTETFQGDWAKNFDYKEIGRWADRVVIMAYDEHGYSTKPGPIASGQWVKDVIRYSVRRIPPEKILLGVPAYGFDWMEGSSQPRYLSYQTALETAKKAGAAPTYDQTQQAPHFSYSLNGEKHQVWYEDARSYKYKAELAKQWKLRGLAIWRLGMEDPAVWE